jgi:hypothetical protein
MLEGKYNDAFPAKMDCRDTLVIVGIQANTAFSSNLQLGRWFWISCRITNH